jgi:hypothetical protein
MLDSTMLRALCLRRQCLTKKAATTEEYDQLFRRMQPVAPIYFSRPGDPPCLVHRAGFDDRAYNDDLRAQRVLVKGRFAGGTVGYVRSDDLEWYIGAYRKDIERMTPAQERILNLLYSAGPLNCAQIKEETGLLVKEIMPALHCLQEAFLVYEDQVDSDWDRGWYVFEREWEGVDIRRYRRAEAIAHILMDFLYLNVFATEQNMKDFLRLPLRDIKEALASLAASGQIEQACADGQQGWVRRDDAAVLPGLRLSPEKSAFMLHRADFLVKSREHELKERFAGLEVLQYLLIDGEFLGVV